MVVLLLLLMMMMMMSDVRCRVSHVGSHCDTLLQLCIPIGNIMTQMEKLCHSSGNCTAGKSWFWSLD